jgi:hypothetical protein
MRAFLFLDMNSRENQNVHWIEPMKTILPLFLIAVSITAARAQDESAGAVQPADTQTPTIVYETPTVYTGQVIYQAPVVYNAPVVYSAAPVAAVAPACHPACEPVSTVVYIGGGHVSYQESQNNCGSTVTYIGGGSR